VAGINRRGVLRLAGATGLAALGGACADSRDDAGSEPLYEDHVRIGLLVPSTGGYRSIGDDIVNGFRRFLFANDNRLGGHPVAFEQEDEGEKPEDAMAGLERLLQARVHAVVGVATSEALEAVGPAIEEAHVPLLGANASPSTVQGVPYIWRTSYLNRDPGEAIGTHLVAETSGDVAIIAGDDASGREAVEGLREAFAVVDATDQLAEPIFTLPNREPGGRFFREGLAQVGALDPAAVFAVYAGEAAVEFVKQYASAGLDPHRLYAPAYLTEGGVLDEVGDAALGVWTAANYAPELTGAANRSFTVAYREEFARLPTIYAVAGYDAGLALDKAIRLTQGTLSRRDINAMLGEVGYLDSPRGRWQFNQGRTPTQKWYLRQVAADGPLLANQVVQELGTLR
jgi:branched-chain amino acid transport system substrate-binding protein